MARRINLVPRTERVRTTTNVPALALLAGGVVVVFILALVYYLWSTERSTLQSELETLENTRTALEQQVKALDQYKRLANEASSMEQVVLGAYAGRTLVSRVLSDLSKALPENVWLTSLNVTAGEPLVASDAPGPAFVSGTGTLSMQGNTYSFPDVALLLVRLKLVPSFRDIVLGSAGDPIGTVDPTKDIRGFTLSTSVINTQPADTQLPMTRVEVEGL